MNHKLRDSYIPLHFAETLFYDFIIATITCSQGAEKIPFLDKTISALEWLRSFFQPVTNSTTDNSKTDKICSVNKLYSNYLHKQYNK